MGSLTAKQQAFIDHYLITLNATEAARRAKYKGNYDTLRNVGAENLTKPYIKAEIGRRLSESTMTADELLRRVSDVAQGDITQYIVSWGELDIEALKADGKGHLLKKYKKTRRTIPRKNDDPIEIESNEVELYPADAAHDKLMRYYSLYNDTTRIKTWQDEIIEAIRKGELEPEIAKALYGEQLALEFFRKAGVDAS